MSDYAELQCTSNFSFLRGGSHPEEFVTAAAALGYRAIGIADRNTLAGIVRGHRAAEQVGVRYIVGCRIDLHESTHFREGAAPSAPQGTAPSLRSRARRSVPLPKYLSSIMAYPVNRKGYGNLCRLLTVCKRRVEKDQCCIYPQDLIAHSEDLALTFIPPDDVCGDLAGARKQFIETTEMIRDQVSDRSLLSIAFTHSYGNEAAERRGFILAAARHLKLPLIATNNPHYHSPHRRMLQDVLTCIRLGCTVEQAGFNLSANAERYLKPRAEMARLFRAHPESIRRGLEIAERCAGFSLNQLRYEYPDEICPNGMTPLEHLTELTWRCAAERYPGGISDKVRCVLDEELRLIHELDYEKYFLTCYDIASFARSQGILCQGRGAAANSAVCYCLGITAVDPARIDLLFARFVSKERSEPPDIDIDFEHERREEVIQYIYRKYGRERAGLTAEVITYRHRSAVREVGKALGLSLDVVDSLAKSIHRWDNCVIAESELREMGLNPGDKTVLNTIALSRELLSFPRHLSQHVGGFIISLKPLCETVPILNARMEDRTIIEWDKDDIETLGMLKIDVLGLGMLTCIRKALELMNDGRESRGEKRIEFHEIPAEDPGVYDMVCKSDTVGVFQIESRAQMSMLPRLKPRCFYDLVIEVAIVRPGPIQGNMVHPYLKRRDGLEPEYYPDKRVEEILKKTLGVPLFQEQAMRLAIVLAGFSPGEAEQLRRAISAWKHNKALIATFERRIIEGMLKNGYDERFAQTCITQIKGFSEYGFPESHAASFALLVYASAWLKRYYPAEFTCALLNSQPMGFYAPSQIIRDAENPPYGMRESVSCLSIDVNHSRWDCVVLILRIDLPGGTGSCRSADPQRLPHADRREPVPPGDRSVRLGFRLIKGMQEEQANLLNDLITTAGPFSDIPSLWHAAQQRYIPLRKKTLVQLAHADAFQSMNLTRHEALWEIRALPEEPLPLVPLPPGDQAKQAQLPLLSEQQSMFRDYQATGLSLRGHPLQFIREYLRTRRVLTTKEIRELRGPHRPHPIAVAGIAIVRQRPGTAKGMVFISIEDETGISNLVIRPDVYERFRPVVLSSAVIFAEGILERVAEVIYVNVRSLESLDWRIRELKGVQFPSRSYSY